MSFVENIKRAVRAFYRLPLSEYQSLVVSGNNDFGVPVTAAAAMKLTAFYAGVRIRSENIASLPKNILRRQGDDVVPDNAHPLRRLIAIRPNDYTNAFDFWYVINSNLDGWGNAYALIERSSMGGPVALHQLHPSNVTVVLSGGRKWFKVSGLTGDFERFNGMHSNENMLHFMLMTFDGLVGVSPVEYNAGALGKAIATQRFGAEWFKKGGNVKAVLETENSLGDEAYNRFMDHYQAAAKDHATPLLEYGIKYKPVTVSPVTAQLIQSETMSIQDIARILSLPPHMLAELSRATFSNIEHQAKEFVEFHLRPTVKRIEVELENKLLFNDELDRFSIKFNLQGLLRGDTTARSAFYHNAILDGYMTRNEVRQAEGLPKAEGLDAFLYPLNSGVVGQQQDNMNTNPDNNAE